MGKLEENQEITPEMVEAADLASQRFGTVDQVGGLPEHVIREMVAAALAAREARPRIPQDDQ